MNDRILAGAMSGTSVDGVDAAVVRVRGRGSARSAHLLGQASVPFDRSFAGRIHRCRIDAHASFAEMCAISDGLVDAYAEAVKRAAAIADLPPGALEAVAAHGQTLYHAPPHSIQWFDPSRLAMKLGVVVISDFRRADLAAGGQGAPLVPFGDFILFGDQSKTRAVINLGGIANVTLLPAGGTLAAVRAFDTGPGNCVLDAIMRAADPRGPGYDSGGKLALEGTVNEIAVTQLLAAAYFQKTPPRSTDGPEMLTIFQQAHVGGLITDQLATAAAWTARSLVQQIQRWCGPVDEFILAGGGVDNAAVVRAIREATGGIPVRRSDELGVPTTAREAMAFALLGAATLDGEPSNVPAVTGATRAVVLGSITPAIAL